MIFVVAIGSRHCEHYSGPLRWADAAADVVKLALMTAMVADVVNLALMTAMVADVVNLALMTAMVAKNRGRAKITASLRPHRRAKNALHI